MIAKTRATTKEMFSTSTGRISMTKFWSFIACMVASYIMIDMQIHQKMTWDLFIAYMGTVGGFSQLSKWMAYKYGDKSPADDVPVKTSSTATYEKPEGE